MKNRFLFVLVLIVSWMIIAMGPSDHSITTKAEIGKKLFFDKRLSKSNTISCGSCHLPEFAFADTTAFSKGEKGRLGKRNTPSAMNMASRDLFFFDGRAKSLEEQASFPIQDHNEMDILLETAVAKIQKDANYKKLYSKIYHETPNKNNILNAIAEFERTLETSSPFDAFIAGDTLAITASQRRGHILFTKKENRCFECHFSPDFTGDEFKNIGLFDGGKYNDSGRALITKNADDIGKFKVPGLRNVAITMPYMHDGSMKTLKEVIRYYNDIHKVVKFPIGADSLVLTPIRLSEQDIDDIENFLISLTDKRFNTILYAKYPHHRRRK
jgi:cytochrome c peroxidase